MLLASDYVGLRNEPKVLGMTIIILTIFNTYLYPTLQAHSKPMIVLMHLWPH